MEDLWKIVVVILYLHLGLVIELHDVIRGLRDGRETGTTPLKDKLLQYLMAMREEVLYEIFLDLHKEYYSLDRDRCLEIREGYGVELRALCLIRKYWDLLIMVVQEWG